MLNYASIWPHLLNYASIWHICLNMATCASILTHLASLAVLLASLAVLLASLAYYWPHWPHYWSQWPLYRSPWPLYRYPCPYPYPTPHTHVPYPIPLPHYPGTHMAMASTRAISSGYTYTLSRGLEPVHQASFGLETKSHVYIPVSIFNISTKSDKIRGVFHPDFREMPLFGMVLAILPVF